MSKQKKAYRLLKSIGDIQTSYIEEPEDHTMHTKKDSTARHRWMKYGAMAACVALLVFAGLLSNWQKRNQNFLTSSSTGSLVDHEDSTQIANPFVSCATLEEAAQIAGFSMKAPDAYETYAYPMIQAVQNEMIEVIYLDTAETEGMRIRKAVGTDPISGDYNQYEVERMESVNGYTVSMRGNGAWINVAEWTDGNYSYSITIEHGISMEALEGLISEVQ